MNLTSEVVTEFPKLVRGGSAKNAEERAFLRELLDSGEIHRISPVPTDEEYNALQQRIRGIAKTMGIAVRIVRDKANESLSLQGYEREPITDPAEVAVV